MPNLSEITTHIVDCEHKTAPVSPDGDYFAVGTPAMRDNQIDFSEARRISEETFKQWTKRLAPVPGDLLFAREAPVGPVVRIPRSNNVAPGQRTVLIRPDKTKVSNDYLFYLLTSQSVQARIAALSEGSTVAHLNVKDIREFKLPEFPAISTQERIAFILKSLDDKIEANTKLAHTADELASALYLEATQNTDTLEPLVDLVTTQYGITTSATSAGSHKLLRVTDINKKPWIEIEQAPYCEVPPDQIEKYQVEPGDLLVARMADPGKVALVEEGLQPSVFASYLVRLKAVNKDLSYFLYYFLRSPFYRAYSDAVGDGSVQRNMNAKVIVSVDVPLLDARKLQEFNSKVKAMHRIRNVALSENQRLSELRDYLLPRLMSGKITVKDAEQLLP